MRRPLAAGIGILKIWPVYFFVFPAFPKGGEIIEVYVNDRLAFRGVGLAVSGDDIHYENRELT